MPPPKYDLNKLKQDANQFLCRRGGMVTIHRLDADRQPMPGTRQSYYCAGSTKVPFEILNTGNVDVLNRYMGGHGNELSEQERSHLTDRIDIMNYLGQLGDYYRNTPRTGVGPMVQNADGQKVLPGVVLDRKQDTSLGCWSCAFSMLLKGRGVDVDQKLIRRYRPEFVEGHEVKSPQQTDIINSNEMSEIYQYSSLVDKVCPNTKMCKMNKNGKTGASNDQIMAQVTGALRDKNAPVAFCNGYHWTTIVGISDDNRNFYVVNSENSRGGQIDTVPVNSYLSNSKAEFVWLEDIVLDKAGKSKALPENRFRVDAKTGSVIMNLRGNAEPGASNMSTCGNHVVDQDVHMEYYVPSMIRNYTRDYQEQKAQSDAFLAEHGGFQPPAPIAPTYTFTGKFTYEAVERELQAQVERNVFSERKSIMRNANYFTQDEIDDMSEAMAHRCYDYIKAHPGCDSVPIEVQYPEFAANRQQNQSNVYNPPAAQEPKNEFTIFTEAEPQPENEFTIFTEPEPQPQSQSENEFTIFTEPETKTVPAAAGEQAIRNVQPEKRKESAEPASMEQLIEEQRRSVRQCARLLKNSKTLVNSGEYNNLIHLMEKVGSGAVKPMEGKTPKEQWAHELYAIHAATEKYLDHKAKDGVKKNVYRKLIAVDRTNKMLEVCIGKLGDVKLVNGKSLRELPVSFEQRQKQAGTGYKVAENCRGLAREFKKKDASLQLANEDTIANCIRSVDTCMCEILMKAEQLPNPAGMSSLRTMRETFLKEPFPPVQDEPELPTRNKNAEKGAVL